MRLAHWPFLLLLLLVPLLHRWWSRRNRPAKVTFSLPIPKSVAHSNPARILLGLKYASFALLVLSLARPQTSFKQTERTVSGIDIMMVMDFSASMNIEDLAERSRLEIAKEMMENFIKGRNNDRIGLVIFSGEPLTLAPPTLDYGLVLRALKDAQIGVLKDGTGIGDGLSLAVNRLRNSTAKSKVIVLLTDGDNNVGQVDPATAGELAAGYGIRVYTIAIGKEGRVRMPIRHKGVFGNTVTTYQWFENALNPELLQQIATRTNGKFYRVTDYDTLESVFKEIDQLEKVEVKSTEKVRYEENYQKPLKLGFFLLILEQLLERGWWRVLP
jgi:Ca-activated chloride channel family protein